MRIMSREELKAKLDRGDDFELFMTLSRQAFDYSRIPGSSHMGNVAETAAQLSPDTEIVVYCSNPVCFSSISAYKRLQKLGFTNIYRYAGGLLEWQAAGYEIEGLMAAECVG